MIISFADISAMEKLMIIDIIKLFGNNLRTVESTEDKNN